MSSNVNSDTSRDLLPASAAVGCLLALLAGVSGDAQSKSASPEEPVSQEIVAAYKYGHQKACIADTGRQLRIGGITLGETQLKAYCSCLGAAYFDDLTVQQHEAMRKTDWTVLPPGLEGRREDIQSGCFNAFATPDTVSY